MCAFLLHNVTVVVIKVVLISAQNLNGLSAGPAWIEYEIINEIYYLMPFLVVLRQGKVLKLIKACSHDMIY